jgi:tRNA threonylcarbamoyladenosine biosynthesis protein TsaE
MIEVNSDAEMQEFGEKLGSLLRGGEVIELIGDVGAGKTTLVRGLARGMGVTETVQSPSFTINRVYDANENRRLVHYDFYRLHDAGIMADELAEAIDDMATSVVIEWADAVEKVLPGDRLTITIISPTENARQLTVTSGGEKSQQLGEKLQ